MEDVLEAEQVDDVQASLHGGGSRLAMGLANSLDPGSVETMARTPQGRFLGLPYNWKRPTWAELHRAYWNPDERRVLLPEDLRLVSGHQLRSAITATPSVLTER